MFYDNFIRLCEEKGISPTRAVVKAGLSKGSLTRWKDGGQPLNEAKAKLAEVLGVSISELRDGEKEKPTDNRELFDIDKGISDGFKQLTEAERFEVLALIAEIKSRH